MADLLYSWTDLEKNVSNGDVGYFHGKKTKFNSLKDDRKPDFIWLVRLRGERLWLLGKLKVSDTRPSNFPKDHAPQYIFYNPSESFFFRDVEAVQAVVQDTLADACKAMRNANMQGAFSVDVLDPTVQRKLERITSSSARIPFDDFKQELQAGKVPCPPYVQVSKSGTKRLIQEYTQTTTELSAPVNGRLRHHLDTNEMASTGYESDPKITQSSFVLETANSFTREERDSTKSDAKNFSASLDGFDGEDQDILAKRRVNQGKFRKSLLRYWGGRCSVSEVYDERLLVASHIVPWSKATKSEQGDPANGLLLSVVWDALFDRGLISFWDDGNAILDKLDRGLLAALGINKAEPRISSGKLTSRHKEYLKRHRHLFLFQ